MLEEHLCRTLRQAVARLAIGAEIPPSQARDYFISCLEYFVCPVIAEIHPEFRGESLDGIMPTLFCKTGDDEAELLGDCYLISDQVIVPLHIRLQLSAAGESISWMECRLGKHGPHGMLRDSRTRCTRWPNEVFHSGDPANLLNWYYKVTFGERRA